MYAIGNVVRFICRYPKMIDAASGAHILVNAFNMAEGNAVMSGSIDELFLGNGNLAALFRGTMEDLSEMAAGAEELMGRRPLNIVAVLAIFFCGDIPPTLMAILRSEMIDSDAFNTTLHAKLGQRGIILADKVKFNFASTPTTPSEPTTSGE